MKNKQIKLMGVLALIAFFVLGSTLSPTLGWGFTYTKTISGHVTDMNSDPILGAKVQLIEDGQVVKTRYTDEYGYYTMTYTGFRFSFYFIKASKSGYQTKQYTILWNNNYPVTRNFQLASVFPMTVTVIGHVYDYVDSVPIEGAVVWLYKKSGTYWNLLQYVNTDENGYYDFWPDGSNNALPTYKVEVTGDFETQSEEISPTCSGAYQVNVYVDAPMKYAVIVGLGSCSPTCVNDVSAWYYHLIDNLFFDDIYLYGNEPEEYNYPIYTGDAIEYNVKTKLTELTQKADSNDVIVYTFAGHGDDGTNELGYEHEGETYSMQMVDYNNGEHDQDGWFHDEELADIVGNVLAGRIFLFLDSCHSGGFKSDGHFNDLDNVDNIFLAMACDETQLSRSFTGEEDPQRGKFSYYFLDYAWIMYYGGTSEVSLEECFYKAKEELDQESPDQDAQVFDTDPNSFYI